MGAPHAVAGAVRLHNDDAVHLGAEIFAHRLQIFFAQGVALGKLLRGQRAGLGFAGQRIDAVDLGFVHG